MSRTGKRSYNQYCSLATALDLVGERWTLLVIRELLLGPRRYAELQESLAGIGTNLLAERLRSLTEAGVIRRTDPATPRAGYELTELGEELRAPVLALARWGLNVLSQPGPDSVTDPRWALLAIQAMLDDVRAPAVDETYVFHVNAVTFHVAVRAGHAYADLGDVDDADLVISTDTITFLDIGSRQLAPLDAIGADRVKVTGSPESLLRSLHLLGLDEHLSGPAASPAYKA